MTPSRSRAGFGLATLLVTTLAACRGAPPEAPISGPTLAARLHKTVAGHSAPARQVAFSPDARLLATSGVDGAVTLWSLPDAAPVRALAHPQGITSVAWSPGERSPTVRLWRVRDGVLQQSLAGHSGNTRFVAFSPDGQWLASSGSGEPTVSLWKLERGQR